LTSFKQQLIKNDISKYNSWQAPCFNILTQAMTPAIHSMFKCEYKEEEFEPN